MKLALSVSTIIGHSDVKCVTSSEIQLRWTRDDPLNKFSINSCIFEDNEIRECSFKTCGKVERRDKWCSMSYNSKVQKAFYVVSSQIIHSWKRELEATRIHKECKFVLSNYSIYVLIGNTPKVGEDDRYWTT